MPPITFNAVGDIIALLQLGFDVVKLIKDTRGAKTDYRDLAVEVEAIEHLLDAIRSQPSLQDNLILSKPLSRACEQVASALAALANFTVDVDSARAGNGFRRFRTGLRATLSASIWALRGSADARAKLASLSTTLQMLNVSLSLVNGADIRRQMQLIAMDVKGVRADVAAVCATTSTTGTAVEAIAGNADIFSTTTAEIREDVLKTRSLAEFTAATLLYVQESIASPGYRLSLPRSNYSGDSMPEMRQPATSPDIQELLRTVQLGQEAMIARQDSMMALCQQRHYRFPTLSSLSLKLIPGHRQLTIALTTFARPSTSLPASELVGVCVGSLITFALSASTTGERAAYVLCACLMVIASRSEKLYKSPTVVHVVFIVDFFGDALEVPFDDAKSATMLHRALERMFQGRIGSGLTQKRFYELSLPNSLGMPQHALSSDWEDALKPGQKLVMNACVPQDNLKSELRCPACATLPPIGYANRDQWLKCPCCPATFEWSSATPKAPETSDILPQVRETEREDRSHDQLRDSSELVKDDSVMLRQELILCKRIRVLSIGVASSTVADLLPEDLCDFWYSASDSADAGSDEEAEGRESALNRSNGHVTLAMHAQSQNSDPAHPGSAQSRSTRPVEVLIPSVYRHGATSLFCLIAFSNSEYTREGQSGPVTPAKQNSTHGALERCPLGGSPLLTRHSPRSRQQYNSVLQQQQHQGLQTAPQEQMGSQDAMDRVVAAEVSGYSGDSESGDNGPFSHSHSSGLQQQKTSAFISLPGNVVRKRPRRRYDDIERLYPCNWPNCNKSYGTLVHLNAHVTIQRHGEKRSPIEFKEMRKQWRKQEKEAAALQAMQQAHHDAQYDTMHSHVTPSYRDPDSPEFPSPTEFSPIESGDSMPHDISALPRRMSLPELDLNGLDLDASPPPPIPRFPHGSKNLPSLNIAPVPRQDLWMQQYAPQGMLPHQVSFISDPLSIPEQRLPPDSTPVGPAFQWREGGMKGVTFLRV